MIPARILRFVAACLLLPLAASLAFAGEPGPKLSWNVDDLPHKIPFLVKELHAAPIMAWTVRNAAQREAARKWADQIVFEGEGRP